MRVRSTVVARAAFSLLELLVAMAILVVVAGVGGVMYMRHLENARQDRAIVDVKSLSNLVEAYKTRHREYPASLEALTQAGVDGSGAYLEIDALIDPWGRPYKYEPQNLHPSTHKPHIYSDGPNPGNPNSMISSWTGLNAAPVAP